MSNVTLPLGTPPPIFTVSVMDVLDADTLEMVTLFVVVVTDAPERFFPVMVTIVVVPAVSFEPVVTLVTVGFVELVDLDLLQDWITIAAANAIPAKVRSFNLLVIDFITCYLRFENCLQFDLRRPLGEPRDLWSTSIIRSDLSFNK